MRGWRHRWTRRRWEGEEPAEAPVRVTDPRQFQPLRVALTALVALLPALRTLEAALEDQWTRPLDRLFATADAAFDKVGDFVSAVGLFSKLQSK